MKKVLPLVLIILSVIGCKSQEKMKVLYVYDALCGWCYGFSPVMKQFNEKYKDHVDVEVISGGMVTGSRIGPIGEVASYISKAYLDVEKATGVAFGKDFLEKTLKNGDAIFTSVPPAIALSVFKYMQASNSLSFAADLQKAVYYDGIEPENLSAYGELATKYGLDSTTFVSKMKDPLYEERAREDFKKSAALGVSGFPTVFVEVNGDFKKIGNGYMPLSQLEHNFFKIKDKVD